MTRSKNRSSRAGGELLIAGLGNLLLRDDGVGVHAVRELQCDPIEGVTAVEVGTAVLDALHLVETADTVVALDAIEAGGAPGTIYEIRRGSKASSSARSSLHELDVHELLTLIPEDRRPEVIFVGVEPETIDYGLELTDTVRAALPRFIETIRNVVSKIREDGELQAEI